MDYDDGTASGAGPSDDSDTDSALPASSSSSSSGSVRAPVYGSNSSPAVWAEETQRALALRAMVLAADYSPDDSDEGSEAAHDNCSDAVSSDEDE